MNNFVLIGLGFVLIAFGICGWLRESIIEKWNTECIYTIKDTDGVVLFQTKGDDPIPAGYRLIKKDSQ